MASNPLAVFKDEILNRIIYPKFLDILAKEGASNIGDLHEKFRKKYECAVSAKEFRKWCDTLNLEPHARVQWTTRAEEQRMSPPERPLWDTTSPDSASAQLSDVTTDTINEFLDPEIKFDNEV